MQIPLQRCFSTQIVDIPLIETFRDEIVSTEMNAHDGQENLHKNHCNYLILENEKTERTDM